MRKEIIEAKQYIGLDFFEETLEDLAQKIIDLKSQMENFEGWSNLRFELSWNEELEWLVISGTRLETDEEYNIRIRDEELKKAYEVRKLADEKAEYERLKKKFENK